MQPKEGETNAYLKQTTLGKDGLNWKAGALVSLGMLFAATLACDSSSSPPPEGVPTAVPVEPVSTPVPVEPKGYSVVPLEEGGHSVVPFEPEGGSAAPTVIINRNRGVEYWIEIANCWQASPLSTSCDGVGPDGQGGEMLIMLDIKPDANGVPLFKKKLQLQGLNTDKIAVCVCSQVEENNVDVCPQSGENNCRLENQIGDPNGTFYFDFVNCLVETR